MTPAEAFAVLGLPITASETEVKAAYRRLVALYHPDRTSHAADAAAERMRQLNDAYAAARAGWHRAASRATKPIYAPPKPPPRFKGPTVPPLHEESERVQSAAAQAAERERREAFVHEFVRIGFLAATADARRSHPVVDAFLHLVAAGTSLRACRRYDALQIAGEQPAAAHAHQFFHAVPSLAAAGAAGRAEALARISRSQVVACTDEHLLWSVSQLAADDGILLREDIDAYAVPFSEIRTVEETPTGAEVILARGTALAFAMPPAAAADLAAHVFAGA